MRRYKAADLRRAEKVESVVDKKLEMLHRNFNWTTWPANVFGKLMAAHQLGFPITDHEKKASISFISTPAHKKEIVSKFSDEWFDNLISQLKELPAGDRDSGQENKLSEHLQTDSGFGWPQEAAKKYTNSASLPSYVYDMLKVASRF